VAGREDLKQVSLRQWAETREADAYLRGVDATIDAEGRSRYNARSLALLAVVIALVAMPIIAIFFEYRPRAFRQLCRARDRHRGDGCWVLVQHGWPKRRVDALLT
jgi:hypothetical protein